MKDYSLPYYAPNYLLFFRTLFSRPQVRCQIWHGIAKNKFADMYTNLRYFPVNIYQFKVNNENTWKWCEICQKLMIKIPEGR